MKVNKRIKTLLDLVPFGCKNVIDVGADHGILSYLILVNNKSEFVLATDISEKCLEKAEKLLQPYISCNRARCMVLDGLNGVQDYKNDLTIIAGMGGHEIVKILTNIIDKSMFDKFLFQPMQDADVLRYYLSRNGYNVIIDLIIEDKGKYYSVILTKYDGLSQPFDEVECFFGKYCRIDKSEDYIKFVNYTHKVLLSRKEYLTKKDLLKLEFCENILSK